MSVHSIAQTGFGVGTNELYDRARPSYQPQALSYIRSILKERSQLNIAELGAGTGIFTRALLAHPEWSSDIQEVKAVEPSAGMRKVFLETVDDGRVSITDGTFECTGVDDQWADLVIIAQAYHWCPNYDHASAEFSRILKPNGAAVFVWNLEDRETARWVAQLRDRIERHEAGTPQFRLNLWRQTFDTPSYQTSFLAPIEKIYPYVTPATIELAVSRAASKSYIAVLPQNEKSQVEFDVWEIVEKGDDKIWIDVAEGTFEYPYKCFIVIAKKK